MLPLLIIAILLAIITAWSLMMIARYRRRLHEATGRVEGPIPTVPLEQLDPMFIEGEYGRTLASEVHFIGASDAVPTGTSDREAWILAALARGAHAMFEFGTATGRTTYLWARNSPDGARVTTITLPPEGHSHYIAAAGDSEASTRTALEESFFSRFLYNETDVESKVVQLYGDSKGIDVTPFRGKCDLIFIDGSHAYSYVKSDSEKSLEMLRDGGIILWHDYRGKHHVTDGVYTYLNELATRLPLVHLAGTSLVAYRKGKGTTIVS